MIKTIRRPNLFSIYDRSGMIRYLKKMAAKGWLLCDMMPYRWKFQRTEPQDLEFSVVYDRKGEDYDFRISDRKQGLIEMGSEAGWHLAAASPMVQIFWTDAPDAVPMQTDPASELSSISAIMRRIIRNELIILAVFIGWQILRNSTYLRVILIDMLTDISFLSGCTVCLLWVIAMAVEWGMYFIWRRKAERTAQTGEFADTPPTRIVTVALIVLIAVFMIGQLAPFLKDHPRTTLSILIPAAVTIGAMSAAIGLTVRILKNKGFSSTKNRLITAGAGFVVGIVFISVFVSLWGSLAMPAEPEDNSVSLPVEIPISDINGTTAESVKTTQKYKASFIAVSHIVGQYTPGGGDNVPEMQYRITKVKAGLFSKAIINKCLKQFNSSMNETENSAFWGADEALRAKYNYGQSNNYMLVYGNYILEIDFGWGPTVEQKEQIGHIMRSIASGGRSI